jgi:nitroreductase
MTRVSFRRRTTQAGGAESTTDREREVKEKEKEKEEALDQAALDEIIRRRRTIKPPMMSDRPVGDAELRSILENANWAPSHGLTEPWRFKVYRGDARDELARALATLYEEALPTGDQKPGKAEKLRSMPTLAPVVLLVWMKRQESHKIREIEEIEAVACAVQNMHLTATALGLGAFWSTPPVLYLPEMNEWMGIGAEDRCLGLFYLGYPEQPDSWPKGRRGSIDDKIEWIGE